MPFYRVIFLIGDYRLCSVINAKTPEEAQDRAMEKLDVSVEFLAEDVVAMTHKKS